MRAAAAWGIARAGLPWTTEVTTAVAEAWEHGDVLNGDVIDGEQWRWSDNPLAETLIAWPSRPVRHRSACG